jgi:hypothetical protein
MGGGIAFSSIASRQAFIKSFIVLYLVPRREPILYQTFRLLVLPTYRKFLWQFPAAL